MKLPSTRWLRWLVIAAVAFHFLAGTGMVAQVVYSLYKASHDNPAEQQKAP